MLRNLITLKNVLIKIIYRTHTLIYIKKEKLEKGYNSRDPVKQ